MGLKIKSVLSVHIYSQRKKLKLFVKDVRHLLKSFLMMLRHPESMLTMRPKTTPGRNRRQ